MFTTRKCFVSVTGAVVLGLLCAACSAFSSDTDAGKSAPALTSTGSSIKETLFGKPAPEPNLRENAPLVMPPANAALPVPGQPQAAALQNPQWPADPDETKNRQQPQ